MVSLWAFSFQFLPRFERFQRFATNLRWNFFAAQSSCRPHRSGAAPRRWPRSLPPSSFASTRKNIPRTETNARKSRVFARPCARHRPLGQTQIAWTAIAALGG